MRIAVVDDDKEITRYLAAALPEKGLLVETFSSGAALKTAMPRDTFDAVVIDWNMPGPNGTEVIEAMQARPEWKSIPSILVTDETNTQRIESALQAGANCCLGKPFRPEKLKQALLTIGIAV